MPVDEKTRMVIQALGPAAAPPTESFGAGGREAGPSVQGAAGKASRLVDVAFGSTPTAKLLRGSERLGMQVLTNVAKMPLWLFSKVARGSRALGPLAEATEEMLLSKERSKLVDKAYKDILSGKAIEQVTMDIVGSRSPRRVREGALRGLALSEDIRARKVSTDIMEGRYQYEQGAKLPPGERQQLTRETGAVALRGARAQAGAVEGAEERAGERWTIEKEYIPDYLDLRNKAAKAGIAQAKVNTRIARQSLREAKVAGEKLVNVFEGEDGKVYGLYTKVDPDTGVATPVARPFGDLKGPDPLTGTRATVMEGDIPKEKVRGPTGEMIDLGVAAHESIQREQIALRAALGALGTGAEKIDSATMNTSTRLVDNKYLAVPAVQDAILRDYGLKGRSREEGMSNFMKNLYDPETKIYRAGMMLKYVKQAGMEPGYLADIDRVAKRGMIGGEGISGTLYQSPGEYLSGMIDKYFPKDTERQTTGAAQAPALPPMQNMTATMPTPTARAPEDVEDPEDAEFEALVQKIETEGGLSPTEKQRYRELYDKRK
jgi:hypothetical protein